MDNATTVETQQAPEVVSEPQVQPRKPPMYKVVLLNDDYTPMDFVVHVLETIFRKDRRQATRIMLEVHHAGRGVCGVFDRQIAETRVAQVNEYARKNSHPLLCTMERD